MLNIQDPTYNGSILLHEALLEVCGKATCGAGAYAFVSADGINLLMQDSAFQKFINKGKYHLIIGMDEITNSRALSAIATYCELYPNLLVNAFLHNTKGSTFHPKFSWFRTTTGGCIIIGSGNLTSKGLRRNREAYIVKHVSKPEILEIELKWNGWVESCKEYLKSIDNPEITCKAEENTKQIIKRTTHKHAKRIKTKETEVAEISEEELIVECDDEIGAWEFDNTCEVLIAEIPIGRDRALKRWCQANFKVETLRSFFETEPHAKRQLILRKVTTDGFLQDLETRKVVTKRSMNYCFELTPPENTVYPKNGRPIGVFVKLSPRTFLYMVIMPEELGHMELENELNLHRERADRLVRRQTNVIELKKIYDDLAILKYLNE